MTLIIMNTDELLEMPVLLRLALKSIYDKKHLTFTEERQLHKSVISWAKYLKDKKETAAVGMLGAVDEERQMGLEIIGGLLQQDNNGEFEARKELFRRHNINYKKFHKLQEAFTPEDFTKGQVTLDEHKRDNPEDYI